MIIDAHTHLFTPKIIANVARKNDLVKELSLGTTKAAARCSLDDLKRESRAAGVGACLLLPTAAPDHVKAVNQRFFDISRVDPFFMTAGTLHPQFPDNRELLDLFSSEGVRAIKLCSFSQGFCLDDDNTEALFELVRERCAEEGETFFVVLDTFYKADLYFGSSESHITTPERLGRLVRRFPEIRFIAAQAGP